MGRHRHQPVAGDLRDNFNKNSEKKKSSLKKEESQKLLAGSSLQSAGQTMGKMLNLLTPYWTKSSLKERAIAFALLGTTLACTYYQIGALVDFANWQQELFDIIGWNLANPDGPEKTYMQIMPDFGKLLFKFTAAIAIGFRSSQELALRWRKWMTDVYVKDWLDNKAFYRLQSVYKNTDNPDQRIQEDIHKFTQGSMLLVRDALESALKLGTFSVILWGMSEGANLAMVGGPDQAVPGLLFWVALGYAGVATYLTHKIGFPLARHDYNQQKYEADFRSSLIRVRENAEQIALNNSEDVERGILKKVFNPVVRNYRKIIGKREQLMVTRSIIGNMSIPFPYVLAYEFTKVATMGALMKVAYAFNQVESGLGWFIDNYQTLAEWKAAIDRLTDHKDNMEKSRRDLEKKREAVNAGGNGSNSPTPPPAPA